MPSTVINEKLLEIAKQVEPIIEELLAKNVDSEFQEPVLYHVKTGGKRIRPALLVLSGQIFGARIKDLLYPAASIEILHNATLIADDIIDNSEIRRGVPTGWKKHGKSITECVILDYLASVFDGLANNPELIPVYSEALKSVVNGEIKDILFEASGHPDESYIAENRYKTVTMDNYLSMVSQKTASLFKACCKAGAICANASPEQIRDIGDFGFNLGMAFQIRDDILDIFGDEKEFGKKIGKDIIEKKMGNILILLAVRELSFEEASNIRGNINE